MTFKFDKDQTVFVTSGRYKGYWGKIGTRWEGYGKRKYSIWLMNGNLYTDVSEDNLESSVG